MPAVNNVLVVGSGLAGAATAIHLADGRRRRRPGRDQARGRRPRLRHHAAGQRAARAAALGVWDQVRGGGLRLRRHRHPRARPGRHRRRRDRRREDRRPRPARRHGHAPPRAGPDPRSTAPPRSASRCGSARRSPSSTRTTPASTSPSPTARPAATTSSSAPTASGPGPGGRSGINLETKSVGMGIWRAFGPRPASVTRTDLYYGGPSYIAGYCPTGENSLYAYIVEDAQDRSALSPDEQLATMKQLSQAYHGPWDEIRETLTDPSPGQLHLVRDPRPRRAVEPRPRRAHRRRRAHLPAHHRPGRRHGARGRRRPRRAADRARRARPGPVGRLPRPPVRARQDRRRRLQPARPVAARPRAGRRPVPDALASPCSPASPPDTRSPTEEHP